MNLQAKIFLKSRFVCTKDYSQISRNERDFFFLVGLTRPKSNIVHKKLRIGI